MQKAYIYKHSDKNKIYKSKSWSAGQLLLWIWINKTKSVMRLRVLALLNFQCWSWLLFYWKNIGSVCLTGNRSIKTEKLNDRYIPYPPWHCRLLKTEKLNDLHILYRLWHSRSLKPEKLNDRQIPYPPWHCWSLKREKLNDRHIPYSPWNSRL